MLYNRDFDLDNLNITSFENRASNLRRKENKSAASQPFAISWWQW